MTECTECVLGECGKWQCRLNLGGRRRIKVTYVTQGWDNINKEHLEKEWGEKKTDWDKRAKSKSVASLVSVEPRGAAIFDPRLLPDSRSRSED